MSVLGIPPDDSQRRAFGHADEHPYRRSPGDWVRLVLATVVVAVTHRLFTTYLPPIGGNFATKKLISDGYLRWVTQGRRGRTTT